MLSDFKSLVFHVTCVANTDIQLNFLIRNGNMNEDREPYYIYNLFSTQQMQ